MIWPLSALKVNLSCKQKDYISNSEMGDSDVSCLSKALKRKTVNILVLWSCPFNGNFLVTLWPWVTILVHFLQYQVSCVLETVLPVKLLKFILRFGI